MYSMPHSWADREIQRLVGPGAEHPLVTTQMHVAWQGARWRLEHNLVRDAASAQDAFAVRIAPVAPGRYEAVAVPVSADGRLHFVARYRYAISRWSIELPRFDFDSSEAGWRAAAEADLARLTGLKTARMSLLGSIQAEPALVASSVVVISAEDCTLARRRASRGSRKAAPPPSRPAPEPENFIAGSLALAAAEWSSAIARGDITCGITLAALIIHQARGAPSAAKA
jgi:hypothetical protein